MSQAVKKETVVFLVVLSICLMAFIVQAAILHRYAVQKHSTDDSQTIPVRAMDEPALDARHVSEKLVDAIIQIESSGNPYAVGSRGERGLMQIMPRTWKKVTRRLYGKALPFDYAFDPDVNRIVGTYYLDELHRFLVKHKDKWQADERSLLLASYNAGPNRVKKGGFKVESLPRSTKSYVERASALHDVYLDDQAELLRDYLFSEVKAQDLSLAQL